MRQIFLSLAFITCGIFTLTQKVNAQGDGNPVPLSLDDCMNYALKHNYAIKNSKLDVKIQQAQNNEITAAAYPRISGKAELDDYVNPSKTFFPTGQFGEIIGSFIPGAPAPPPGAADQYTAIQISPKYAGSFGLSGSQTLFDGTVLVALQARNTVMELSRQNGEVTEENVRYNITKAYGALVIAYRQYNIISSSLKYARDRYHDLEVTQQNGMAEKIDVERSSVQITNLATDSISIGNMLVLSEAALKYNIGMDINTPIVLTDTNLEERKQAALELLNEEKDYNRVPEYSLLKTQLQADEYNLKRYKLAGLPTLSIFGNAGYNYASNDIHQMFLGPNYLFSFLTGLQLNVPIFNGFMRTNQVEEARLNIEKVKNNIDNEKLTIDFQETQARTSLRNSVLQAQSQNRNLAIASDVLDLAQKKYKAGVGSNLEVTNAQTDQLTAQNNYFNALLNVINAEADLKKALGLLKNN
ncbi:MAG TPA: TolC family protein [Flavipsychrobacter sp.]|nr:TolC family protein [Flavipsychrobacter sp.]